MGVYTIYHNSRCSKSRQALVLLTDAGVDINVVDYLNQPLSEKQLESLLVKLDLPLSSIVRNKEQLYKELELKDKDDSELLNAIAKNPKLMERPIVVCGQKAVIGRPPENVKALL